MVVDRNFKQRSVLCDTVHGTTLCEFRSVHEEVDVTMQECRDADMKPLDLILVDTDKSVDRASKKIRSRLCARQYKTKKQGKIQRALPVSQLFSAMPPLEAVTVLISINH